MAHAGHGGDDRRLLADAGALGDHSFQFLQAPLSLLQIGEQPHSLPFHQGACQLQNLELFQPSQLRQPGVGDVRLGQGKQARGDRTFKHGDTGLIHLTTSISTTYAQLASTDPPVGAQVEIYGWGGISAPGGPLAKQLKMAVVRVTQVDSMVHAVQVTGAAYHGDSGGPMFYQGKQIGTCTGQAGAEFIYPSVAQARSWIRQTSGV